MKHKILFVLALITGTGFLLTTLISWKATTTPVADKAVRTSVIKAFSMLQTAGATFISKARCASCHHSTMTSMISAVMKRKGISDVDTTSVLRDMAMTGTLDFVGNPNLNNQFVSAKFLAPYVLLGMDAEKHAADFTTDIAVNYIISQALPDGSFKAEYARVPLECGDIHLTALSIRAIQLYAPKATFTHTQELVQRTKQWLEKQHSPDQQELSFQLLGLHWCGSNTALQASIAQSLIALQNKDGGWSQLPSMASDAYATGQSMYALILSGAADSRSEVYQKGIRYLLETQDKTGAWTVATRSNPIQPFVNSNFPPYDDNQFISAAATNWATLALAEALPDIK